MARKIEKINKFAATATPQLVSTAVALDRHLEDLKRDLSLMKAELIERAARAPEDQWKNGENDSKYIDFSSAAGEVAQVLAPTPTLKTSIDMQSQLYADIRSIIRSEEKFWDLFIAQKTIVPIADFRDLAEDRLGKEQLRRVLDLVENDQTLKVVFRTKEKAA